MLLYLTADHIGTETGGGLVTAHELRALQELGETQTLSRKELSGPDEALFPEPWKWDYLAVHKFGNQIKLCQGYAGCFPESVRKLKANGAKVVWTVAAHDRFISRREHETFGIPFSQLYPHLCEEEQWQKYITGYRLADVIVCPSTVAANTVRAYGPEFANKRIEVIAHGCDIPEKSKPLPKQFTVGYLGSCTAPDKGVVYLLQAWKQLGYRDAVLMLGGRDSDSPQMRQLIQQQGGGNIILTGWVKNVSDFYNQLSVYIQPSMTEGFGIEVLEAMAHGRPILCSTGAGASEVGWGCGFSHNAGSVDKLANQIHWFKNTPDQMRGYGQQAVILAQNYTWDKIRKQYQDLWRTLL